MDKNIEKILFLKTESDKWRSIKVDFLEFRSNQFEEKEKAFSDKKKKIEDSFYSQDHAKNNKFNRLKGHLDIFIECYDKILEKSTGELFLILNKCKKLILEASKEIKGIDFHNQIEINLTEIFEMRKEIFDIRKLIKEEVILYSKEVISTKELNDFLSKTKLKIEELELSSTEEKKANYILSNRLIEKDEMIKSLKSKLDLRELNEIDLNELLEPEKDEEVTSLKQAFEKLENDLVEKDEIIIELKKKLAEFEEIENANETLNQSIREINLHRNTESDFESMTTNSESNYSLIEQQVEEF